MVHIQSSTAEIRRGKKEERKKKPHDKNIMACTITQGGHNKELHKGYSRKNNPTVFFVFLQQLRVESKHVDISDVNSKPTARFHSAMLYNLENMQTAVIHILNFQ